MSEVICSSGTSSSMAHQRNSNSLDKRCTCSQCCVGSLDGSAASIGPSLDSTNKTFIDLSRQPPMQQVTSDLLLNCDSIRSQLPIPNNVWGWLTPTKPCSPAILTRELAVTGDQTFTVGREQQCNLVLEEFMFPGSDENLQCNKTSRIQFEIIVENDRPHIVDKSMNGTFVNGDKLSKAISKRLNHGDVISVLQAELEMFCYLDENQMMNRNYPLRIITKYLVGNIIGSGSYSVVRKGFTRNYFTPVAMKFIRRNQNNLPGWLQFVFGNDDDKARSEVDILQQLHHPCITKILDVVETTFELVIVMEFAEGGELEKQVKVDSIMGNLGELTAKFQFYQICHAIAYLHSKNICHRDLKLANILLMEPHSEALLKVSDFGVSKIWSTSSELETLVGTPAYMAPEVLALLNTPHLSYSCKSDCWSLGVILYVLLSGSQPFNREFLGHSVQVQIMSGSYQAMTGNTWDKVSTQAKDLIRRLLVVSPNERLSAARILQHPWFSEDVLTCSRARNKMFGTQDSETGSVVSQSVESDIAGISDNGSVKDGVDSKAIAHRSVDQWREPPSINSDIEEVDMRSRLRPRVTNDAIIPSRVVKTPGEVGSPKVTRNIPIKGTSSLMQGTKRKDSEETKQVTFLLPGKRRRRNSEIFQNQTPGLKAGRKGRRRRMTGM